MSTTSWQRRRCARERRGAALVVALVTIAVLASVTAITSSRARQGASVVDNRRSQAVARAMAESGVLAARARIESALRDAGSDSVRVDRVFEALTASSASLVHDTITDGAFTAAVVDVSARLDVNAAGAEGLQQLFATVAPPDDARRVAESMAARVRGDTSGTMQPFTSLDELLTVPGIKAEWLDALAPDLTVDGDGRVNRLAASRRVLAASAGTLVDRPSRLLVIARGWRLGHVVTREIQAVFDVSGMELRLVRWREQDR